MKTLERDRSTDRTEPAAPVRPPADDERLPKQIFRKAVAGAGTSSGSAEAPPAAWGFGDAINAGVHPSERVQRAAAHGLSGTSSALPHLDAIQRSFGRHDIGGVRAHVGGAAAEGAAAMGAHGYATGNAVAFARSPDLHLAAHEAAHVVQQRGGVHLRSGVGEVGDVYERHADAVADLVVQGQSAESLLDTMAGGAGASTGVQRFAVQMDQHDGASAAHGSGPAPSGTDFGSRVLGSVIALCGGEMGTERTAELAITVPYGSVGQIRFDIQLRVAHEREGFHAHMQLRGGGGVGIPHVAYLRLMAGVALDAVGHDAAATGRLLLAAARTFVADACSPLTSAMFHDAPQGGAGMLPGESTDVAGSISVEGGAELHEEGAPDSEPALASVGLSVGASRHDHMEGRADGAHQSTYNQFDLSMNFAIKDFRVGIEAHIPAGHQEEHPPELTITVSGTVSSAKHGSIDALADAAKLGMRNVGQWLHPHAQDPRCSQALAAVQLGLGAASSAMETAGGILFQHCSNVGLEVAFELGGEHPQARVRVIHELNPGELGEAASHLGVEFRAESLTDLIPPISLGPGPGAHEHA